MRRRVARSQSGSYGIDYPPLEAMYFATDGNTFNENDATVLRVFASPVTGLEIRR